MADIVKFICNDYVNELAGLWNEQRAKIARYAAEKILFPQTVKWLKERLGSQASDWIAVRCQHSLESKINHAPFPMRADVRDEEKIMAISWGDGGRTAPAFGVVLNEGGQMIDYAKIEKLSERESRDGRDAFIEFVKLHDPYVIVLGGFKTNTRTQLYNALLQAVEEGHRERTLDSKPPVVMVDDEPSRIFMKSKSGLKEFPESDYPPLIRYCVSLGRLLQEPTCEYAALYNPDEDVRTLRLDPLQSYLPEDVLMKSITRGFVNVVNDCGVDINAAANYPHLSHTLQFVSGLGPRKSQAIISKIVRGGGTLESRADLIQKQICGTTVFVNCASFIRIKQASLRNTATYDVLDDTRVHPEDYELARKMAADALDLDDTVLDDEDAPSSHVQELMDGDVDRLNLLLLDDYAVELERRMHAPKRVCLNDIKQELMAKYRDRRAEFREPSLEELFTMLTGESPATLYPGAVLSVVVIRVKDKLLAVQLESGVEGTIFINNIDVPYGDQSSLLNMFVVDQPLNVAVLSINYERMGVELSARKDDIENGSKSVRFDAYFDYDRQRQHLIEKKSTKKKIAGPKRTVQHPFWKDINYKTAEAELATAPRGQVIVRPSAKGNNNISITWKVDDGIYQHIGTFLKFSLDILEKDKPNEWSLGRTLIIDGQVYQDIDHIIATYVEPMTRKISMLLEHPKYQRKTMSEMYSWVSEQMQYLGRSAYGFTIIAQKPGCFCMVYQHPSNSPRKEEIIVGPLGYEFRKKRFADLNEMLTFFKISEQAKAKAAAANAAAAKPRPPPAGQHVREPRGRAGDARGDGRGDMRGNSGRREYGESGMRRVGGPPRAYPPRGY